MTESTNTTNHKKLRKEYMKQKLINEIIHLTDQQAKHRARLEKGDKNKSIQKFIKVVNRMILAADLKLQKLLQDTE